MEITEWVQMGTLAELVRDVRQLLEMSLNLSQSQSLVQSLSQSLSLNQSLTLKNASASNFLLVCYCLASLITRKCRFLAAFILCEILGSLSIFDILSDATFYLCYSSIYCLLYYYCVSNITSMKTKVSCIVMAFFDGMVATDAYFYQGFETFIYSNYACISILIHLYIISTFIDWRRIRSRLGESLDRVARFIRANDAVTFVCYTVRTKK